MPIWAAVSIAIGAVSAAEIAWEVGEYYVRYRGHFHYSAYYDTLADMANSAVGAFVGALLGLPIAARLPRRHS